MLLIVRTGEHGVLADAAALLLPEQGAGIPFCPLRRAAALQNKNGFNRPGPHKQVCSAPADDPAPCYVAKNIFFF